jgi:sulfopyruvate decarboxylase TPP-binding subunit
MQYEKRMNYKAYFGIKYHEGNHNRDEIVSITAALQNDGISTICVARDIEKWGDLALSPQELMGITFKKIDETDFVVLEMSEKGVGLGIEAGYAVAKNKPLVILIKAGLKLSNTMQGIADVVITYDRPEEIRISTHNKALHRTRTSRPG